MRVTTSSNVFHTDCETPSQIAHKEGMAMKSGYAFFWVLSLFALTFAMQSGAASAADEMKADQSAGERIGGQAGLQAPIERRTITADSLGGLRVGGQAGLQAPLQQRTIAAESLGAIRVGSQAEESDPEKPDSEAK